MDQQVSRATAAHAARLDRCVKALQTMVKEQETALEKLRVSSGTIATEPADDRSTQLLQLRTLKAAYENLTPTTPYLPPPDSPLPALLALRTTHKVILDTKESLASTQSNLTKAEQHLTKEHADVNDAKLISQSLETRIHSLEADILERTQKSSSQVGEELIRDVSEKKAQYDSDTSKLVKAFNKFIDDHLASMLAAEELGGPVVGELLDVDEASLEAGFSTQGKVRKSKRVMTGDKRQQRIDDIWGSRRPDDNRSKGTWDEKTAAASEMRELTEMLLNKLVEADGGANAYVHLDRESAAARFLVRSKVAQFHPKDAKRLRLIDFGRDLDE